MQEEGEKDRRKGVAVGRVDGEIKNMRRRRRRSRKRKGMK
jgi:hypothetical protein